jgi:hypothetical protein
MPLATKASELELVCCVQGDDQDGFRSEHDKSSISRATRDPPNRPLEGKGTVTDEKRKERLRLVHARIRKGTSTDEQYEECFREHLPYEINMFRALFAALLYGVPKDSLTSNAYIESFFLHARNLINFFKNDTDCGFDPRYFTDSRYEPIGRLVPDKLQRRINHQVPHLGAERSDKATLKLGPDERLQINEIVEKEIARFEKALDTPYDSRWRVHSPVPTTITFNRMPAAATNSIIVVASDSTTFLGNYKINRIKEPDGS